MAMVIYDGKLGNGMKWLSGANRVAPSPDSSPKALPSGASYRGAPTHDSSPARILKGVARPLKSPLESAEES